MQGQQPSSDDGARRGLLVWERVTAAIVDHLGPEHVTLSRIYEGQAGSTAAQASGWCAEIAHSTGLLGCVTITAPLDQVIAQKVLFPHGEATVEPRPLLPAESAAVEALVGLGLACADAPMWLQNPNEIDPPSEGVMNIAYELTIEGVSGWLLLMLDGGAWLSIDEGRMGFPDALLDHVDPARDWLSDRCSVQVGLAQVTLADDTLEDLTIGDVLLPVDWIDDWRVRRGTLFVDRCAHCVVDLQWSEELRCAWSDGPDARSETASRALDILFGELKLSMAEVLGIRQGPDLELAYGEPPSVTLVLGGEERGRGELITVEGRAGVRITEWQ